MRDLPRMTNESPYYSEAILAASRDIQISSTGLDEEAMRQAMIDQINALLTGNFDKLVSILYRMDVDENKLKQMLRENKDKDAAQIIYNLMIERQLQKIKWKREHPSGESYW